MKKLLAIVILLSFSMTSFAQYIEGQDIEGQDTSTGFISTMSIDDTYPVTTSVQDDVRICTMDYNPVCAEVQVQCIKAPCFPINQTFGNACGAGDNKILYKGECNSLVNSATYKRYQKYENVLQKKLVNISTEKLEKMLVQTNKMIAQTPMLKMAMWALEIRTTQLVFIKNLFEKEINSRY